MRKQTIQYTSPLDALVAVAIRVSLFLSNCESPRTSTVAGIYLMVESDSLSPATIAVLDQRELVELRSHFLTCLV